MVLLILMLFSIFYCTAGKLKRCQNLRGPFTFCLNCDGSEVVDCNSVAVDRYMVSFDMTDRCCVWKMVLCWFGLWDASLGVSSNAVSTLSIDWLFFAWGLLLGMRADKTLDALSSRSASFGPSLRRPESGLGSRWTHPRRSPLSARSWSSTLPIWERHSGCSRTNAWRFSPCPRRRLPAFFSKASTVYNFAPPSRSDTILCRTRRHTLADTHTHVAQVNANITGHTHARAHTSHVCEHWHTHIQTHRCIYARKHDICYMRARAHVARCTCAGAQSSFILSTQHADLASNWWKGLNSLRVWFTGHTPELAVSVQSAFVASWHTMQGLPDTRLTRMIRIPWAAVTVEAYQINQKDFLGFKDRGGFTTIKPTKSAIMLDGPWDYRVSGLLIWQACAE